MSDDDTMRWLTPSERAELDQIRRSRDAEPMADFVARIADRYAKVPPHLLPLYELIERSRREQVFATISQPPRHGKTITFSFGITYRIAYDPACQNYYTTFVQKRADAFGRVTRMLAGSLNVPLDRSAHAVDDWKTMYGGGLNSTSIGGPITGEGANGGLIVVDDIVKGTRESRSRERRDAAWDYFRNDVMSRVEGGASVIVINTRWHDDDIIGRIKKDPLGLGEVVGTNPWRHINLPAVHDGSFNPIDEREHPELATPLWLDVDSANPGDRDAALRWYALARKRGEYAWWSLFQGAPRSESMKIFRDPARYTLKSSRASQHSAQPFDWTGKRGCIVLDPAATKKTSSDFNAIGVIAIEGHGESARAFVVDALKKHMTMPEAARMAVAWKRRYNLPLVIEGVGGFAGVHQMVQEIVPGLKIESPPMFGDKFTRAQPAAAAWNDGRFLVPVTVDVNGMPLRFVQSEETAGATWMDDVLEIAQSFTGVDGNEDDLVDMLAHGYNFLNGSGADRLRRIARW